VEVLLLSKNRLPGQPGLIDLEKHAAEERVVVCDGNTVVAIVIDAVHVVRRTLAAKTTVGRHSSMSNKYLELAARRLTIFTQLLSNPACNVLI
jgi:hypothetical protein